MRCRSHISQTKATDSPWSLNQKIGMFIWGMTWTLLCAWTPKPLNAWRLFILRIFGTCIEGRPFVHQRARIQIPWNLTLKDHSCLGDRADLYTLNKIVVGEHATIAQQAYLCTGTHAFHKTNMELLTAPIIIGPRVFIGARAFIFPGITIGADAIVGACAVVTHDIKEAEVVAGNPAKVVGSRIYEY